MWNGDRGETQATTTLHRERGRTLSESFPACSQNNGEPGMPADPANAATYRGRAGRYDRQLADLDAWIRAAERALG